MAASLARAIGAILAAMLDPKQRHKLLRADRTRDVTWIRASIAHLMAAARRRIHGLSGRHRRAVRGGNRLYGLA